MLRIVSAQRIDDNPEELNDPNLTTPVDEDLPVVTPENVGQYVEPEEDTEDIQTEPPVATEAPVEPFEPQAEEQPYAPEVVEDTQSIIDRAINEQQCLWFEYNSLKGNFSVRLLECYGTFQALGTGNFLLVGWDRTVGGGISGGGIRAFVIDRIQGVPKIMPGEFYHFEPNKFIFSPN